MGYDAFLLVSFGGPEGPDDVMPFLRNVTRGRGIPEDRLAAVAEHYRRFGGVSPINGQCRDLIAAIGKQFDADSLTMPIYWGNRNWHPYLADTVARMRTDGVERAIAFVTSGYGSYSSCRQYLDDIAAARATVGPGAPVIDKIRHFHDHPGYVAAHADGVRAALATLPAGDRATTRLVFTAHSIPSALAASSGPAAFAASSGPAAFAASSGPAAFAASSGPAAFAASSGPAGGRYESQLREACRLVATAAAPDLAWDLVYQSRSGSPSIPWLGPDVNDHLRTLAALGATNVVVSPVGFISDHLEVVWDLDNEAAATAAGLGLGFARAATPGTHPDFVAMIGELVAERLDDPPPVRRGLGTVPTWDRCPVGCCPAPARRPAGPVPDRPTGR